MARYFNAFRDKEDKVFIESNEMDDYLDMLDDIAEAVYPYEYTLVLYPNRTAFQMDFEEEACRQDELNRLELRASHMANKLSIRQMGLV